MSPLLNHKNTVRYYFCILRMVSCFTLGRMQNSKKMRKYNTIFKESSNPWMKIYIIFRYSVGFTDKCFISAQIKAYT